jgi:hypothetical protein
MSAKSNRFNPYDADRPLGLRCACGSEHVPVGGLGLSVEAKVGSLQRFPAA